jgi:hypothetical protein
MTENLQKTLKSGTSQAGCNNSAVSCGQEGFHGKNYSMPFNVKYHVDPKCKCKVGIVNN